jgi:tal_mycobact: transaldolase
MTEATQRTSDSGVSIWLDDLSRSRIESGSLQDLIANKNVVGVTTNPSIFQKALHEVGPYDPQLKELGKVDVETAYPRAHHHRRAQRHRHLPRDRREDRLR